MKTLLSNFHTSHLFKHILLTITISALRTFSFDSSELANEFKPAFQTDTEWDEAVALGDESFSISNDLVFHKDHLFIPSDLHLKVLHSHHDS